MGFLEDNCTFSPLTGDVLLTANHFSCGHPDLDDFFLNDSVKYSKQYLGKSYCFLLDNDPKEIICAFTVSNDSIRVGTLPKKTRNKVNRRIPYVKQYNSYPAVLIGRLGVNKAYRGKKIGCELMDFIKAWFIDENNKTGCRFILVDAYNEEEPLKYYNKNSFLFLYETEDEEREFRNIDKDERLHTRLMSFDLIVLAPKYDLKV
ncbi:GNAT family N-acetyltransferase [Niabella sp. CC-SYL272]|uniref:GNAT family N-acetyltransferase n=1 Tax=Niabella agricola TaxID=2891571 RepID=UPI001F1966F3|nr:GNAT family N-acetyltransferase [Niabella agricola]MCF3107268.1 GNAT family N-acetyltransferase [Niabella agricola]